MNCDPPFPPTLIYPARFIARDANPSTDTKLLRLLRALGDDRRLRALRLIAKQPRSTQELAALIAISEAGLSKHLKALADAELLTTSREGYYVLYSLNRAAIAQLSDELQAFLES